MLGGIGIMKNLFACYFNDTKPEYAVSMCCVAIFGPQICVQCLILFLFISVIFLDNEHQ